MTTNMAKADTKRVAAEARELLGRANHLLSRRRALDAREMLEEAKAAGADSTAVAMTEAGVLAALYRFDDAEEKLRHLQAKMGETPRLSLAMIDLELARGNPAQALEIAYALAPEHDDVRYMMRQVAAYKMLTRDRSVVETLIAVVERYPDYVPARMQLADILRRAQDREGARAQLEKILEIEPGHLVATAYLEFLDGMGIDEMMDRNAERARAALAAARSPEARAGLLIEMGDRELFVRRFRQALECYEAINDPAAGDDRRLLQAARCHMQLAQWDEAIALAQRARAQAPDDVDAVAIEAAAELAKGNADRYVDLLLAAEPRANRRHFRQFMTLVFNLHALERHDEAEALLERWERLADQIPQQDLVVYYRRRQMEDKLSAYNDAFRDIADDSLVAARMIKNEQGRGPDDDQSWKTREIVFGIGVPPEEARTSREDLDLLLGNRGQNAPQSRNPVLAAHLGWALCEDKSMGFEDWLGRVRRATEGNRRLSQKPPLLADLEHYVVPPDVAPLRELIEGGRAFVMASSHMGPRVTYALSLGIPELVYVMNGYMPIAEVPRIPFAQREPQLTAIKLVSAIRKGHPVLNMVDTPVELGLLTSAGGQAATGTILGVPCSIPGVLPKLSQQLNVPSFFAQPRWEGDRVAIAIERLPDPESDERPSVFANRWAQAYLDKLLAHMWTAPENQNLTAPMWRHLLIRGAMRALPDATPPEARIPR